MNLCLSVYAMPLSLAFNVIHLIFIFVHKMNKPQNRLSVRVCPRLRSLAVLPISLIVIIGLAPPSYLLNERSGAHVIFFRFFSSLSVCSAKNRSKTNYILKYKKATRIELEMSRNGFFSFYFPKNSWNTAMEF